jgi:hypothetical protein
VTELERELRELGRVVALPPDPDLAPAVRARLGRAPRHKVPWRPLAIALAALALAFGVAMAVPDARSAILRWLGLSGVRIELVDKLPEVPTGGSLPAGAEVTRAQARRALGHALVRSDLLGEPDRIYALGRTVTYLYGTPNGARVLLTTLIGDGARPELIKKIAGSGTRVEQVEVGGEPGFWLAGAPHVVLYRDPEGQIREDSARLAGDTLLWQHGPLTLRLEGRLTREQALEIARSVS